jgi:hypothetical protein
MILETDNAIRTIRANFIEARGRKFLSPKGRIYGSNPVPVISTKSPCKKGGRPYTALGMGDPIPFTKQEKLPNFSNI